MPAKARVSASIGLSGRVKARISASRVNTVAPTAGHTKSRRREKRSGMLTYLTGRVRPLRRVEASRMVVPDALMSLRALP